jgi:hypothetical protein
MSYPVFMVPAGDVLPVMFATFDGGTGASITLTGLAATDIEIYKDGSVTQRSSDAGYTLLDTDGIDFDGITGIHGFSIDTGNNTDASFYTVGSWFTVVVSAVTIDAQTVSFIACQFRLMAAESVAAKPKVDVDAWLGTAAATPSVAGVPEVDLTHVGGATTNVAALATNVDAILTDTSTTLDDLIDTEIATIVSELAKVPKSDGTASWNATALAAIQSEANDALVAYDPPTKAELDSAVAPLALEATLATVDNLIDTEIATLITMLTGIVPVNGTIGATGNSTTALHLDGIAWADDGPNSMLLTIQDVSTGLYYSRWIEDFATTGDIATVATLPFTPEASVDKYWLTPVRADVTGGSGLDAAGVRAAIGLASANLDTQLTAIDDAIDSEVAAILADTNELQTDLTNGGRLDLLIDAIKAKTDNLPAAPAATGDIPTAAAIADAVWDEAATGHTDAGKAGEQLWTDLDAVLVDTGTTLQGELDGIQADTEDIQTKIGTPAGASVSADIAAVKAETASILDDTDLIDDATSGLAKIATDAAAILVDTGTTLQGELDGIQADTEDIQARLPAALTAGGNIKADMLAVSGDTTAADRLEALMDGTMVAQVNDAGASTTAFIADGFTEATNDHFIGRLITFISGALSGQQTAITDYVGATQTFTVTALTEAPANGDFFVIH